LRVPGEYDGSETRLPDGVFPMARLQTSAAFRKYLKDRVKAEFAGVDQSDGLIAEAYDESSEMVDEVVTIGNLLVIHGFGLKIEGDEAQKDAVGLYFVPEEGGTAVKVDIIAVNEPRTLKVIVPALEAGKAYRLKIVTQSSAKHSGTMLKTIREVHSDFVLSAHD
jgi:hypothetical protein